MLKNLEDEYWKEKFEQFFMNEIVENFPKTVEETKKILNFLRDKNER